MFGDRVEQRRSLQTISRRARPGVFDNTAPIDRVLHRSDNQANAQLGDAPVAIFDHLFEVVARVDMHQREWNLGRRERAHSEFQHHDRVFAAGKQQHGPLESGRDLANDVYRLVF